MYCQVLIDPAWVLPLSAIAGVSHRFLFYHWDTGKLGRYFHFKGDLLATVGATERMVGQVRPTQREVQRPMFPDRRAHMCRPSQAARIDPA